MRGSLHDRLWSKVRVTPLADGCWEFTGAKHRFGYGKIGSGGKHGRTLVAHRVSFQLAKPGIQLTPGDFVCHRCDNPPCVRPDHLFLGTPADNMRDCSRKNRVWRGSPGGRSGDASHYSKITEKQATEIVARKRCGEKTSMLAVEYGISTAQVNRIFAGKSRRAASSRN